jgi:hypothetical protein
MLLLDNRWPSRSLGALLLLSVLLSSCGPSSAKKPKEYLNTVSCDTLCKLCKPNQFEQLYMLASQWELLSIKPTLLVCIIKFVDSFIERIAKDSIEFLLPTPSEVLSLALTLMKILSFRSPCT